MTTARTPAKAGGRPVGSRPDLRLEKKLLKSGVVRLAAMDEVGRGALAGPVSVGVVLVTAEIGRVPPGLRDSKLLTAQARQSLIQPIRRWVGAFGVGHATAAEIDEVGIMAALRLAGRRALDGIGEVDAVLLDGNHNWLRTVAPAAAEPSLFDEPETEVLVTTEPDLPVHLKIKADLTCAAVAAASVLAKTERDEMMIKLGPDHPDYSFAVNKGYGTPEHLAALRRVGPSAVHRRSWRLGLS